MLIKVFCEDLLERVVDVKVGKASRCRRGKGEVVENGYTTVRILESFSSAMTYFCLLRFI